MINWKVRLRNKTFVATLATTILALVYTVLGMFEVVPPVTQSTATEIIFTVINLLALLGIIVDPTTDGLKDSERVLNKKD